MEDEEKPPLNEVSLYEIDDIEVYGDFYDGERGVNYNILLNEGVDWEDIINWGRLSFQKHSHILVMNQLENMKTWAIGICHLIIIISWDINLLDLKMNWSYDH